MMVENLLEKSENAVTVLRLSGRFDAYGVPQVCEWLTAQRQAGRSRLVVDLHDVSFLDSAALATLVKGMKESRAAGGDLHLACLQVPVRIIFELTGVQRVFSVFESEADAVAAFLQ